MARKSNFLNVYKGGHLKQQNLFNLLYFPNITIKNLFNWNYFPFEIAIYKVNGQTKSHFYTKALDFLGQVQFTVKCS